MAVSELTDYETILKAIRQWPLERRFALVQDVLDSLASTVAPGRPREKTLEKALGLLATDQSPPTDEQVTQWLHEHRMEKYG